MTPTEARVLSMPPDAEVVRGKRHIFLLHFVMRENFTLRNYKCTAAELSSQLRCVRAPNAVINFKANANLEPHPCFTVHDQLH